MKILFIVPYPIGKAPSQRFRFEQYFNVLGENGWKYEVEPFLDDETWNILYKPGYLLKKTFGIISGFVRRFLLMFHVAKFDYVFIHREAAPIGPPVFEWILAKILKKRIVYDFDDAIWLSNTSENNKLAAGLKWHHKVESICKWAYKVSCGNKYLCDFASQFNSNVVLNPTTIDTQNLHNPELFENIKSQSNSVVIGWTGTHSTMKYLEPLLPVLEELEKKYKFELAIISNQKPDWTLKSLKYYPWNKETEIKDLLRFDVGIMPLTDDKWAKGKCGFKALQYMALGIPALVSPVGVNTEIVDDGVNGFICSSNSEWANYLAEIIRDFAMRNKLGFNARQKIESNFSVLSNTNNFVSLFN